MAETSSISQEIETFRTCAIRKGDFAATLAFEQQLYMVMAGAYYRLMRKGAEGQRAFKALLKDENLYVRSWAATQLLTQGDRDARAAMQALTKTPGRMGESARATLDAYAKSQLRPPFPPE
jgi:hypothetical protein